MVEDIIFYPVLFILIGFVVFFIAFMIWLKSKLPHPLLMKVLSTLHASLFGYETALIDLIGTRGYKTHVFPQIINTIKQIKDEDPRISELFNAVSVKDAMEKWLEVLKLTKITKEGKIIEKGEDEYEIMIPDCTMCNPIHAIIGEQKGICPMALILAGASSVAKTDKELELSYSEFFPTGTKTILKFVTAK